MESPYRQNSRRIDLKQFRAFRIHGQEDRHRAGIETVSLDDLDNGEVLIRTHYSSINYKDALAGTGKGKILRRFPLTGGVDCAGEIAQSKAQGFREGDPVLITGYGLSEVRNGGYAEYLQVPAELVVPLPEGLTLFQSMALGSAGFTAALALYRIEHNGQTPDRGAVVVTGASGGVGSIAVALLAKLGYSVIAVSGKQEQHPFLKRLGAAETLAPSELPTTNRPLGKALWGAAIDNVGGDVLAELTRHIKPWGNIASIGLAAGSELHTTVMPFILRGISLLGIDSVNCPYDLRTQLWRRLATDLRPEHLDAIVNRVIRLEDLPAMFAQMLERKIHGRIVVETQPG